MKKLIPQAIKNIYHLFRAILANVWYGFPSRKLKVIGVTGTNGKTTTVQMIAKILEKAGYKIAVASTINFKIIKKEWVNKSKFTTLSSWSLQKFLKQAVRAGCEYAVIEVSSHSLDQNRARGVDFDVAVITNVTREHLDYHETMEEYAKAKEKLFHSVSKKVEGAFVVNLNMEFADVFLQYGAKNKFGYFLESQSPNGAVDQGLKMEVARGISHSIDGSQFLINGEKFRMNLPGEFNIENALAATCVGLSQNIPIEKISAALSNIEGVPGRMEKIENSRDLNIIVDYAVTPDSLEKLYSYLNGIKKDGSKIIAVFGSCGQRDRGKRPIMGEIVAQHADFCIVTNEDPYHEDPQQIIAEVFAGVEVRKKENENAWRILDRREAIKKALQIAKPGDIVVVTGKGAEEAMAVGDKRIPWNDPKVIREILREPR
ncbi:MAG: UDP-N-acetylmuramoyl-L-alanyl-D-glutamate--2,6-diaminopimelate ligase [Parcubacteria group bacterium]|jgi:UDP-N-acetylmuramoyl-L-alanyl-D-glutamate--2,6-diaminopimelate ligase